MLLLTVGIISTIAFVGLDGHKIIYNICNKKYKKFRSLNSLVATQHKNKGILNNFLIIWKSLMIIKTLMWLVFIQKINNSVVKKDNKTWIYSYVVAGKSYKKIITKSSGPSPVIMIFDENMNDVTDLILPYLGPKNDWDGHKFTPKFWNRSKLSFELATCETIEFEKDQIIDLNQI